MTSVQTANRLAGVYRVKLPDPIPVSGSPVAPLTWLLNQNFVEAESGAVADASATLGTILVILRATEKYKPTRTQGYTELSLVEIVAGAVVVTTPAAITVATATIIANLDAGNQDKIEVGDIILSGALDVNFLVGGNIYDVPPTE